MICLLRVGFDDAEEPNETLFGTVTDRLGNYRIQRCDDGTAWELGHGAMGITYRAILREEVGGTVAEASEVDAELRHLCEVLAAAD